MYSWLQIVNGRIIMKIYFGNEGIHMKIQILGTAAYERVPALFCRCAACLQAIKLGGKNIRTQAQTLIDDTLLVDFGRDNYLHFLVNQKDYTKLKCILITHSHSDHFVPEDFLMTVPAYGHNDITTPIQVVGNAECFEGFARDAEGSKCVYTIIQPYETIVVENYRITALPADHGTKIPLCYIIQDAEKTLLYNNDTGIFKDAVYEFIQKKGYRFDAVIADCTYGLLNHNGVHHMSLADNEIHREKLTKIGAVHPATKWIITHFSHNGLFYEDKPATAEKMEQIAQEKGMICAYDGIEFFA